MNKIWSENPLPRYNAKPLREKGIGYLADDRGNRLPEDTSILYSTKPLEEKARLANWRSRLGSVEANRIISQSTQIGKLARKHLDRYFQDENTPCPELIKPHWENLLPILQELHDVRLVKGNLFNYYKGYAGRVDCVASFCDIPCAIDFKFTDRIKPLYDEPLQLAAYVGALNRQYGPPYGSWIDRALLIVVTPDGSEVTLFEPDEVKKYWRRWEKRLTQFWAQKAIAISS